MLSSGEGVKGQSVYHIVQRERSLSWLDEPQHQPSSQLYSLEAQSAISYISIMWECTRGGRLLRGRGPYFLPLC